MRRRRGRDRQGGFDIHPSCPSLNHNIFYMTKVRVPKGVGGWLATALPSTFVCTSHIISNQTIKSTNLQGGISYVKKTEKTKHGNGYVRQANFVVNTKHVNRFFNFLITQISITFFTRSTDYRSPPPPPTPYRVEFSVYKGAMIVNVLHPQFHYSTLNTLTSVQYRSVPF